MTLFITTERIGVNEAERISLEFSCIPHTIFQIDVGINMEVEICEDDDQCNVYNRGKNIK